MNLYVWNTSFSSTLFKKLIQNWFLISFIASWYEFHICIISAHASSFLHLFQICFFDNSIFCISMSSLFHQSFDFTHIRCLNTNRTELFDTIYWINHENELLKLSRDRAHHWHDAHTSFRSSRANEKHHWSDVNKWMRSNYHYLAEEFSQDKKYTEKITQAASTLWAQRT